MADNYEVEIGEEITLKLAEEIHRLSLKEYRDRMDEEAKSRRKRVLSYVRKMAENYRVMKKGVENSLKSLEEIDDYRAEKIRMLMAEPFKYYDDLEAISIVNIGINILDLLRFEKTVDSLEEYYINLNNQEMLRRFRVFRDFYMSEKILTVEEIAAREQRDIRALYRDIEKVIELITMSMIAVPI